MKIIYCHHAERDVNPNTRRTQNDDITENGIKDAELVSELLQKEKISFKYQYKFNNMIELVDYVSNASINTRVFNPRSLSVLPLIAASVNTLAVSWNDAADKNESVSNATLVIPSNSL